MNIFFRLYIHKEIYFHITIRNEILKHNLIHIALVFSMFSTTAIASEEFTFAADEYPVSYQNVAGQGLELEKLATQKYPVINNDNSFYANGSYTVDHPGQMVLFDLFVADDFLDEYRIPSITQTQSGKLIAAIEKREANGDKSSNDIVIRTSTDGGRIWTDEQIVATDQISFNDPNFAVADNGDIYLFFNALESHAGSTIGNPTNMQTGVVYVARSTDDGDTWSTPQVLETSHPEGPRSFTVSPGVSVVLKNGANQGDIILPIRVNHTADGISGLTADVDIRAGTIQLTVDDSGIVKTSFGSTNPDAEVNEYQIAEMGSQDSLYYISRDTDGLSWGETSRTLYSSSYDNGQNWNNNGSFGFFTTRTQSGLLRSDYNSNTRYYYSTPTGEYDYSKARHQGYIFESAAQGEGISWKNSHKVKITDLYFGNSTMVDLGDKIGLIYEFAEDKTGLNVGKVSRIRFMSLSKDYIRNGENAWPSN